MQTLTTPPVGYGKHLSLLCILDPRKYFIASSIFILQLWQRCLFLYYNLQLICILSSLLLFAHLSSTGRELAMDSFDVTAWTPFSFIQCFNDNLCSGGSIAVLNVLVRVWYFSIRLPEYHIFP